MSTQQQILTSQISGLTEFVQSMGGSGGSGSSIIKWESGEISLNLGGVFSVERTHGLGQIPDQYEIVLKCAVVNNGYSIGDEVLYPYTTYCTSTNIGFSVSQNVTILNKGGTAGINIDNVNWRIVMRAYRYLNTASNTGVIGVESLGGASGAITLGSGLSIDGNILSASGTSSAGGLGVNQTWHQDSSKVPNTVYQNAYDKPIFVTIAANAWVGGDPVTISVQLLVGPTNPPTILVDALSIVSAGNNTTSSVSAIVPPGAYYKVVFGTGTILSSWAELY